MASFIYTSHVNDGICDCCDGSDEWNRRMPSPCRNTCEEEGRQLRKELAAREALWKKGVAKRVKLIEASKAKLEQAKKDLVTLQAQLPDLEAAQNSTAAALKVAQRALDRELFIAKQKESEANNSSANASTPAEASESEPGQESSVPPVEASTTSASPAAGKEEGTSEEGDPAVSEYTKWMDGAEKAIGNSGTVSKAVAPPVEDEAVDDLDDERGEDTSDAEEWDSEVEVEDETPGFFAKIRRNWVRFVRWLTDRVVSSKTRSHKEILRDDADKAHKDAKKKFEDARKRLKELHEKVDANYTEDQLAFLGLEKQCISKKLAEYKYEVCFFETAKQDSVSIGKFERWEGSSVAFFDNGLYCPGGPSRTLRVRFDCGDREEILDVTEPSRCTYEAKMSHPAACTGVLPSEAQQGRIRRPSDEEL